MTMRIKLHKLSDVVTAIILLGCCAVFGVACKDDSECNRNSDCGDNALCTNHECVPVGNDSGSTQVTVSTDSQTASDFSTSADSTFISDSDTADTTSAAMDSETITTFDTATLGECLRNDDCDDGNPCTADYCKLNVVPYSCDTELLADGSLCDDSDPCNGQDVCESGTCVHGTNPCVDLALSNGCGVQAATCDPSASLARLCVYELSFFDDATACMVGNPCVQGACTSGECVDPQNACGVQTDPCYGEICSVVGTTLDDFQCTPSVNETDTNCVNP